MIAESVKWLAQNGRRVIYDAEHFFDGYKDNAEYALATLRAAAESGADVLVLCDTNGGSMPADVRTDHRACKFRDESACHRYSRAQ